MLFHMSGGVLALHEGTPISAIRECKGTAMNRMIYIIGLIVVIVFVLGVLGLR